MEGGELNHDWLSIIEKLRACDTPVLVGQSLPFKNYTHGNAIPHRHISEVLHSNGVIRPKLSDSWDFASLEPIRSHEESYYGIR